MAVSGPFGFVQYFQNINQPQVKRYWISLIKAGNVFTQFPITTEGALLKKGKRVIDGIPVPTTVAIGQEPATPFAVPTQDFEEGLSLWRDNFIIDRALLHDKNYVESDPTKVQIRMYKEGLNFALNNYFFNNNKIGGPIADANGFIGIKYRLLDNAKYGTNSACRFASTSDLSDQGISGAGAVKITRDFDKMFDHMDIGPDGEGAVAFMNPQGIRQFAAIIKTAGTGGGFEITKDQFDRTIMKYRQCKIVSCGYLPPLQGGVQVAPIIDSAQDSLGYSAGDWQYAGTGSGSYTSIYFVKGGPEDFMVWQQEDPWEVKERVPGTRQIYCMFDQSVGIFQPNTRAIGQIFGIKCNGTAGD